MKKFITRTVLSSLIRFYEKFTPEEKVLLLDSIFYYLIGRISTFEDEKK